MSANIIHPPYLKNHRTSPQFSYLKKNSIDYVNYCINPECQQRQNPENLEFCQTCGTPLLINGRYRLLKPLRPLNPRRYTDIFEVDDRGTRKVMKILKDSSPQFVNMLEREARTLRALNHPGLPRVDMDGCFPFTPHNSNQEIHCLLMEKIEGKNLEVWLLEQGTISQFLAVKWLRQLIEIIELLHKNNFFHRDIKPSNIMLKPDGQLVLIDFGTVRKITETYLAKINVKNVTTIMSGGYTPLEQIDGRAVPQSDFYALGRTFVHLLTGKHPVELPTNPETGQLVWQDKAPQISKPLADFIDDLMALLPANRPQDATVILRFLTPKGLLIKSVLRLINSPKFQFRVAALLTMSIVSLAFYRAAYPLISQNYYEQGLEEQRAGRLDQAWHSYEKALEYNPKDARIYNNQGFICQAKKDFTCAKIKYEAALHIDPSNSVTRYNLGGLYDDAGEFDRAEYQYKLAIESDSPVAVNAISDLARLRILDRDTPIAIDLTTQGLQKTDNLKIKSALYKNRGWAYLVQTNYAKAKTDLQKATEFNPERADSYCLLAQVLEAQEGIRIALIAWQSCLERDSRNSVEVKIWKTMALQRLRDAGEKK